MRRLARTFAARIGDKYQIRLTWSIFFSLSNLMMFSVLTGYNIGCKHSLQMPRNDIILNGSLDICVEKKKIKKKTIKKKKKKKKKQRYQ